MAEQVLYPLLLEPTLHVKVWGGRKLEQVMGKSLPDDEPYGEAWEVHDSSVVANGPLAGRTVGDLLAHYGTAMVGPDNDPDEGFPLLIKLLDAADWLSVQVHPDDEQAARLEGNPRGKTEAWVILAADPGAKLVVGVEPGTPREAIAEAIRENNLEDLLVIREVTQGDVLYMPAGTVHAIGPGVLLYEVQQSSDTTYRLYDWGRMGLDGTPRTLHVEKGVSVANVETLPEVTAFGADPTLDSVMVNSPYFYTARQRIFGRVVKLDTNGDRFHAITCIEGRVQVVAEDFVTEATAGRTVLVPASVGPFMLDGDGVVLRSWQAGGK